MCSTIVVKFLLFLYCRRVPTPISQVHKNSPLLAYQLLVLTVSRPLSVQALALDHRNDVVSNSGALLFALLAQNYWLPLDPIGAIFMSLYIIVGYVSHVQPPSPHPCLLNPSPLCAGGSRKARTRLRD